MQQLQLSICASAIRTQHWGSFSKSLVNNKASYEIVFVGPKEPAEDNLPNLRFIKTANIKPAQCHQIAAWEAKGTLYHLTADDCEYPDGILDDIWAIYNTQRDQSFVIACGTIECGKECLPGSHRLYSHIPNSPIMAPLLFMPMTYLEALGGYDKRYTGGQFENDLLMRVHADGGRVIEYNDKPIIIDHFNKHNHHTSDFSDAYKQGRKVLEASWPDWSDKRQDTFQPFEKTEDILVKSQGPTGIWM